MAIVEDAVPETTTEEDVEDSDGDVEARERVRQENIKALLSNSLVTCRKPILSKLLIVQEGEVVLKRAFKSPSPGAPAVSDALKRKLVARRRFIPWGDSKPFVLPSLSPLRPLDPPSPAAAETSAAAVEEALPEGIEPLVLWEAPEGDGSQILVDNMLTRFLRPHQREGVQFMFECVTGLRMNSGQGCILADDMGLGKTLQGISLLWTLLQGGHPLLGGHPVAHRVIIVCPTSLVSNWDSECVKWLKGKVRTLPLCESSRDDVISGIRDFLSTRRPYQVLIISYETFRLHSDKFRGEGTCDLLICDEAHRLKNDATLTNRALDSLQCKRRVLLSGTPLQNHLDEFYAMVDFCNPGILGGPAQFRKYYEIPILAGREPDASDEEVALGDARSAELSALVNPFILRRTNKLLSAHLPPKVVEVVCCRMTPLQHTLYCHYLESTAARKLLSGKTAGVLSAITSLKKLCNHPKLIYDAVHSKVEEQAPEGFENVSSLFPPGVFDNGRAGRGGMAFGWELLSGKMAVATRMLHVLNTSTDDRIVIVSNYTQTLDLFSQLCREKGYPFLRLDGSTSISKRQKLVKAFNDRSQKQFVFLLSSKAGGCGLNLIGANRLILFDPDWNPANDKQAAARVWRDGQQKRVYVYRFLTTGTIEEKVFQRQVSKEGLQSVVNKNGKASLAPNLMSAEQLRELFSLKPDTLSDTYDGMCEHKDQVNNTPEHIPQVGAPAEEDLKHWGRHPQVDTVPDEVLRQVAGEDVTFVFTCSVEGKEVELKELGATPLRQSAPAGPRMTGTPARCPNLPRPSAPARMISTTTTPVGLSRLSHYLPQESGVKVPLNSYNSVRLTAAPTRTSPCSGGKHHLSRAEGQDAQPSIDQTTGSCLPHRQPPCTSPGRRACQATYTSRSPSDGGQGGTTVDMTYENSATVGAVIRCGPQSDDLAQRISAGADQTSNGQSVTRLSETDGCGQPPLLSNPGPGPCRIEGGGLGVPALSRAKLIPPGSRVSGPSCMGPSRLSVSGAKRPRLSIARQQREVAAVRGEGPDNDDFM